MEQKAEVDSDDYVDYVDSEDECEGDNNSTSNAMKTSRKNIVKKDATKKVQVADMREVKRTDSKDSCDYYYDTTTGEQGQVFWSEY